MIKNTSELVKVTPINQDLVKISSEGIPFLAASEHHKNELMKLQKTIRAMIQTYDGVKKGPGRPSHSPKNISQRLGVVSEPLDFNNIIEAEIHYPEAFQKFINGVLKSSSVNHIYFHFLKDRIIIFGDGSGGVSRLEMDINCNKLLRYYCEQEKIICIQRDFFDVIKTSNGKVHSRIYICMKRESQNQYIFIMTDVGSDKGSSDTKMGLSLVQHEKEINMNLVDKYLEVTIPSQLLKNEISSSHVANQTDFLVRKKINKKMENGEEKEDLEQQYIPMIRTCNSQGDGSKSLEKIMNLQDNSIYNIIKPEEIEVKIKSQLFRQYISMMSKFATNIKICVGKIKKSKKIETIQQPLSAKQHLLSTNDEDNRIVVFEMQCDNEENNIFCVNENELQGKISHLYGYDYICRCYCFSKTYLS